MAANSIKILAIDDHSNDLVTLKALIRESFPDAQILTAMSGMKGLEIAATEDPDIILLDVVMPVMDGFEVCKNIKMNFRLRDIPVVFITAQKGNKESRIKAMEVGADAFLAKPVDVNELTAQIRALAKIKHANIEKRNEKERLTRLVDEKTREQRNNYIATLNLLEDLNRENEARKKNEIALKKSEQDLADIFQTVKEGIAYCTITGDVLATNASLENIFGLPASYFNGKNIISIAEELLSAISLKAIMPSLKKLLMGKSIGEFQVEYKEKILEITFTINQHANRLTGVVRDITQRRLDEKALIDSEYRFRSLVESAFDGIYLTNGKFFYFVNEKFCEITGYSEKELTSPEFDFNVTLSELSKEFVKERNWLWQQNEKLASMYELQIVSKNNQLKMVEVSTINLGQRNDLNVLGIVRDITERKKIESQMIQSERLSALGEMAAGMAHELNQPLNTLSILFDNILLEARLNGAVGKDYLENKSGRIFDNITRVRNLIDHVRDFSRSQDDYILNLFNINQCISNALSMVSEQFRIKGIELVLRLDEKLPLLKGNIFKFEQVILNFISNAKDALLEKKAQLNKSYPMLVVITTSYDKKAIYVKVEDNGIGIRKSDLEKVMLPFFTTKETGKGNGLGLSISYGIIKELGGRIDLNSEPMKGTTVMVTISLKSFK